MKKIKILYVDGGTDPRINPGGSVEGMRLLIKELNPDEFESLACCTFPFERINVFSNAGAQIVTRLTSYEDLMHRQLFKFRGFKCLNKYLLARRLAKIIQSHKPDILHINLLQKWDYFDLVTARRLGVKTVGHMRSLG